MNSNLYSWHDERMVALEMQELAREIDNIRLIKEAGLSNPGILERLGLALGGFLVRIGKVRIGKRLREHYISPRQAYQITSGKFAA